MYDIEVSIICNAYNHEKYIRDALDGFVMQKTDFKYEILIHDDASTDRTAEIIREYEKKYPDLIKPIYQTENQYSKGRGLVGKIQRARVRGKYTAICEGDDYWTDPYKLQKQFDAMEAHPEIDMCSHAADVVNADTKEIIRVNSPANENGLLPIEDVIMGGGGYVMTCTLFYRSSIDKSLPKFRQMMGIDYFLQIHGALRGGILFLVDNMAAYRAMTKESWTSRIGKDIALLADNNNRIRLSLEEFNSETGYKYDNVIKKKILKNDFELLVRQGRYKEIRKDPYRDIYKGLSSKRKLRMLLEQHIPVLRK